MLHLASRSPRRRALLARLGVAFGLIDVDIHEARAPGEPAEDYVRRMAREKAGAGLLAVAGVKGAVVLGADTEVVLDDEVFGKPADAAAAADMLRRLAGRTHEVLTAVSLVSAGREIQRLARSRVTFAALDEAQIGAYVASGEPMDRAGGYAIQGGAERFVTRLDGSFSGVMGLPLHDTMLALHDFGLQTGFQAGGTD